jgi:hypothetical protein
MAATANRPFPIKCAEAAVNKVIGSQIERHNFGSQKETCEFFFSAPTSEHLTKLLEGQVAQLRKILY